MITPVTTDTPTIAIAIPAGKIEREEIAEFEAEIITGKDASATADVFDLIFAIT
jgi:hypothetical protein